MHKHTFQDVLEAKKGAKQKWALFFKQNAQFKKWQNYCSVTKFRVNFYFLCHILKLHTKQNNFCKRGFWIKFLSLQSDKMTVLRGNERLVSNLNAKRSILWPCLVKERKNLWNDHIWLSIYTILVRKMCKENCFIMSVSL